MRHSSSSSAPAARWIAPSTPPPPSRLEFAAFTIASTSSCVMLPCTIEIRPRTLMPSEPACDRETCPVIAGDRHDRRGVVRCGPVQDRGRPDREGPGQAERGADIAEHARAVGLIETRAGAPARRLADAAAAVERGLVAL